MIHDQMRLLWDDQAVYTRLVLIAFQANVTGDLNASFTRLLMNAELLGNASQHILGQAKSQNLTMLLKEHDQLYMQILNETRSNNTQTLSNLTAMWYQNAAEIAALFNGTATGLPSGNQTVPGGNQTIPGGNQTIPGWNQTVPGGNQTVPGGNQTVPSGNQTQPSNQTKPAIIWIVAGSAGNMSSLGFSPDNATVIIGVNNTVTWINNDTTEHTVRGMGGPAGAPLPNSSYIPAGQNYTFTFTVPGTYLYHCAIHTWMQGVINVQGNQTIPSGNQTVPGGNQTVPVGNQTQQRALNVSILVELNIYLNLTLHEVNDYMQGNYSHSISDFDQAKSEALTIADKISAVIIAAITTTTTTTTTTNTTTTTTNTTTTTTNVTTTVMVSIMLGSGSNTSSLGYSPNNITIMIGVNNTVTWTNDDTVDHTVTSTEVPANATSFDSVTISSGGTYTYTFTVPGTIAITALFILG